MHPFLRRAAPFMAVALFTIGAAPAPAPAQELPACRFSSRSSELRLGGKAEGALSGSRCRGESLGLGGGDGRPFESALYRFVLTEPRAVEIEAMSERFPPGVGLFRGDGGALADADGDWGFEDRTGQKTYATLAVTLQPGTYFVGVYDANYDDGHSGSRFEIRLRGLGTKVTSGDGGLCDMHADAARREPLAFDAKPRGSELNVADCFQFGAYYEHRRFTLAEPRTVAITAEGDDDLAPELSIISVSTDKYLQDEDDADESDAGIRAELPAGDYILEVSGMAGFWETGRYRLRATRQ